MGFYRYRAIDGDGKSVSGRLAAASPEAAAKELRGRRVDVFELKELEVGSKHAARKQKPKLEDYSQIIEQLGVLSTAGISILEAVETVAAMAPKQQLVDELRAAGRRLRQGETLSDAIEMEMEALPSYVPNLLRMGEATGQLAKVTKMISAQMTKSLRT